MKMRKLVAVLLAVLMLCCIIPFSAVAEDTSVTIDLTTKDNRTAYSTSQQVWEQNGITITNDKGASTSNVGDYANPGRFYKSSTVTIEYPGMTKIEIDSVTYNDNDYAIAWTNSFSADATAVVSDGNVTITFAEPVDSFTWEKMSAQARAYSITVYAAGGASEPETPAVPVSYEADFDTIVTTQASGGDSGYSKSYTTESGWTTENAAIQVGGDTPSNPVFPVIGADNTSKAVCINGKTSAIGKISSPVLSGGIHKLTINYTKMFTDTLLSATITITDVATGAEYTSNFSREVSANDDKYVVWTYEWVLETPIAGDFTIVIANDCPSQLNSNKDRMTILDVIWETTGSGSVTPPVEPDEPDIPVEPDVPVDDTLTIEEAIALGQTYAHNTFSEQKYYVTGVITEVYNEMYGNMKLTDEAGNILTIYGTWSADGATRYDALEVKPVAGDTITVYGIVGQYNGTSQVKNGWIVEHTAAGGETPDEPSEPSEPETPDEPEVSAPTVVTNPVAGVAYKFALEQTQKGALYYFTGAMSGYYGATETDLALAVDMYVEIVDGGYKLYFNDANGAKQYIKLEQSGTHYNFTFGAEGSVFTLDAEKNAFCAPAGDQICYMGTYGSYVTIGCLTSEKISDSDYIARLYAVEVETPDTPVDPDTPADPETPDSPETGDNTTVYVTLAAVLMALAAAAAFITSKKRA